MALNPKTSSPGRDRALNAVFDFLNSGNMRVCDSTQPTDCETAVVAQVDLADLGFGSTAFNAASGGSKAATAITQDSSANANGTATWATCQATGVSYGGSNLRVFDMSAGVSGSTPNLVLNSAGISAFAAVSCSGLTFTQAA